MIKTNIRVFLIIGLFLLSSTSGYTQVNLPIGAVISDISQRWREDSSGCKGLRLTFESKLLKASIDKISKDQLIMKLGKPNRIRRFYDGLKKKDFVGLIYDTYKDNCPKITFEGRAVQFTFEETDLILVEITLLDDCS